MSVIIFFLRSLVFWVVYFKYHSGTDTQTRKKIHACMHVNRSEPIALETRQNVIFSFLFECMFIYVGVRMCICDNGFIMLIILCTLHIRPTKSALANCILLIHERSSEGRKLRMYEARANMCYVDINAKYQVL